MGGLFGPWRNNVLGKYSANLVVFDLCMLELRADKGGNAVGRLRKERGVDF